MTGGKSSGEDLFVTAHLHSSKYSATQLYSTPYVPITIFVQFMTVHSPTPSHSKNFPFFPANFFPFLSFFRLIDWLIDFGFCRFVILVEEVDWEGNMVLKAQYLSAASRVVMLVLLLVGCLAPDVSYGQVLWKKSPRGGPAGAMSPALQMLMKDSGYEGQQTGGTDPANPRYDDLVALMDSLSKVRALGDYFSHRGRPRYVRWIRDAVHASFLTLSFSV